MDLDDYRRLRSQARRHSRRPQDADDLVQDVLVAALEARRFDEPWLAGVLRNKAALAARGAVRRRRRETAPADAADTEAAIEPAATAHALLARLPTAARRVAVLALHGLGADEIRWILGLTPAAFRQRVSRIRRHLGELPPQLRAEALALAYVRDPARSVDLQFGLVRRALKAALQRRAGLGTHDVDGHLIVIRAPRRSSAARGD
jgi:RNA polymerase sigma factor (sigma-70 family)